MGIAMELEPSALAVDPGRLGRMEVHLTNTGPGPRAVAVELPTEDRDWSWVHPESCSVTPGDEVVVAVFFKPKCGPHPTAGTHTVDIVARAEGEPDVAAQGRGTVDVGPFVDAAGALDPMVAYDHMGSSYTFHLENRGNVPVTADLCTEDPSGALDVSVQPARISADPGQTASATVAVQARKKLKRGEHTFRVCVLAQVEGASDLRIEGAFRQQGIKPAK
ncbi:MAG: COG1470 family protein [Acidimicrobiales bacterium]